MHFEAKDEHGEQEPPLQERRTQRKQTNRIKKLKTTATAKQQLDKHRFFIEQ